MIRFEWDEVKNKSNFQKHGLWFEETLSVFDDPLGRVFYDRDHSHSEDRFFIVGADKRGRTLVVVHHYKESNLVIRIISARRATKKETRFYEKRV